MTDSLWPSKLFQPEELLSPAALQLFEKQGLCLIRPDLITKLEILRSNLMKPMLINFGTLHHRGFRTPEENAAVGGKAFSQHMYGCAVDVTVNGMTLADLAAAAERVSFSGIGVYDTMNFVHMDVRYNLAFDVTKWGDNGGNC